MNTIEFVFVDGGIILDAVGRQLQGDSTVEIGIQVRMLL